MKMKLAILDLYDGTENQGMRCIKEIANYYDDVIEWEVFDVRGKAEVPNIEEFDIYISTGGPGNPIEDVDGIWDKAFFDCIDQIFAWNQQEEVVKKHVFLICHSFQMVTHHLGLSQVTRRKSRSFGTFPTRMTDAGRKDLIFEGLPALFYISDFREFQVVEPNMSLFDEFGASILALEKIRPHVDLDRAIMGIRYSDEVVGVQFHPEADPDGMTFYFSQQERRDFVEQTFGIEKYHQMIHDLNDENKIPLTHKTILPNFLSHAIRRIQEEQEAFKEVLFKEVFSF
jgi:homoserine O-succinyltransferase/O-acetyltransferase